MNKLYATLLVVIYAVAFGLGLIAQPLVTSAMAKGNSRLYRAFKQHETQEYPEVKADYRKAGGEEFVTSERWKNYQKYAKECPAIAEVVEVEISKTSDGGEFVVRMMGPDAGEGADGFAKDVCSLWINGGKEGQTLKVRDFSSY